MRAARTGAAVRLRRMSPASSPRPRSPFPRALAASGALCLALTAGACTIDGGDDDEGVTTTTSAAAAPAEPAGSADPGSAPPAGSVDQLVLTAEDAPEWNLQPVPADQIAGGLDAIGALTAEVRVEPERCAEVNADAAAARSEPGSIAIQGGQVGEVSYAVAVSRATDGLAERARQVEDCPVMSVAFPLQGEELVTETRNSLLDVGAPEGVEDFAAVLQDSSVDMMGQTVSTSNLMITGVVRGLAVSVTASHAAGPVPEDARATALEVFARQADKIRAA